MGDLIISIFFVLLSSYMYISSLGFISKFDRGVVGADGFPKIIAIAMFILAVVNIIKILKLKKIVFNFPKEKILQKHKEVFVILLLFAIYVILMKRIGFLITSILFMISAQWYLSNKSKKNIPVIIVITLFISLGTYYFFTNYLNVIFPAGTIFN